MALERGVVACATLTASAVIGGLLWYNKKGDHPNEGEEQEEHTHGQHSASTTSQQHCTHSTVSLNTGGRDSLPGDGPGNSLPGDGPGSVPPQIQAADCSAQQQSQSLTGTESGDMGDAAGDEDDAREEESQRGVSVQTEEDILTQTTNRQQLSSPLSGAGSEAFSESVSEASSSADSGKGGSLPPSGTSLIPEEADIPTDIPILYQFEFPTEYCGRLIGRQGKNIKQLRESSGAKLLVKDTAYDSEYQLCVIEGLLVEVEEALRIISQRFPSVDVNRVVQPQPEEDAFTPLLSRLALPQVELVQVCVSSIVSANHVFLQQPAEVTFGSLPSLDQQMTATYSQPDLAPPLPQPHIEVGLLCAAPMQDGWYRAEVVSLRPDGCVDARYVDYGGYSCLQPACLRQIHSDFTSLPFQATECYLANIAPLQGEECFSEEARLLLEEMTQSGGQVSARVIEYALDGCPLVQLNLHVPDQQVRFLNYELAEAGLVSWVEDESDQARYQTGQYQPVESDQAGQYQQ